MLKFLGKIGRRFQIKTREKWRVINSKKNWICSKNTNSLQKFWNQ